MELEVILWLHQQMVSQYPLSFVMQVYLRKFLSNLFSMIIMHVNCPDCNCKLDHTTVTVAAGVLYLSFI